MSRKRIALFIPTLNGGGAERVTVLLANGLSKTDDVTLLTGDANGPNRALLSAEVNLVDFGTRTLACRGPIRKFAKEWRPDALLAAMNFANMTAILATIGLRPKPRLVVVEHTNFSLESQLHSGSVHRFFPFLARMLYPLADALLGVSKGVAQDLQDTAHLRKPVQVAYNPVISDQLLEKAGLAPEHPYFKDDIPVIVSAGRLGLEKDFATLLKASALVQRQMPVRTLIYGAGDERDNLISLAKELGIEADLPGFTDNPYAAFKNSAVFAMTSQREGLPGALIEALACGTPVVSTDCPSGPREVLQDGKYGKLVPLGSVETVAEAILDQLQHPLMPPKESWEPYTVEAAVKRYREILLGDASA